jgi:hypothetical protein
MTTTLAQATGTPLIGKCRNGHVVRGAIVLGRWIATTDGASVSGNAWLICPCGSAAFAKCMNVTIKAEKVCNGICMGATGPSCSCSCGGENHGANHAYSGDAS